LEARAARLIDDRRSEFRVSKLGLGYNIIYTNLSRHGLFLIAGEHLATPKDRRFRVRCQSERGQPTMDRREATLDQSSGMNCVCK
jgi:hypothetical protein